MSPFRLYRVLCLSSCVVPSRSLPVAGPEQKSPISPRASVDVVPFRLGPKMRALLAEHGLAGYTEAFQTHQIDEAELLMWDVKDLIGVLGCPAGPMRRLWAEVSRRAKSETVDAQTRRSKSETVDAQTP